MDSVSVSINSDSFQHFTIFVIELLQGDKALYKPCSKFEVTRPIHQTYYMFKSQGKEACSEAYCDELLSTLDIWIFQPTCSTCRAISVSPGPCSSVTTELGTLGSLSTLKMNGRSRSISASARFRSSHFRVSFKSDFFQK